MTETYAILDNANGHLVNTVLWDGDTAKWQPPTGTRAELLANVDLASLPPAPAPEAAAFTAEEWVAQFLSSTQLIALADLRLDFALRGLPLTPLMQQLRDWTTSLMVAWAADPTPKSDWTPAPCTYEAASSEAVTALSQS